MSRAVLLLAALACTASHSVPNRPSSATDEVRSRLDSLVARGKVPGIQYVVVDSSGVVFEYAGGRADIRGGVAMDHGTTLMAYSMSKTITAAAVLQLVERGLVGLDDPVDRYVGENPYGGGVTVRGLLAHTAGVPNPIPLRWVHPARRHETFDEPAALASVLAKHRRLKSQPGETYRYSNIGYWLLGRVVEKAGGTPFTEHVRRQVLEPLGLAPGQLGYVVADPGRHATGYLEKYSVLNLASRFLVDAELIGDYEGRWLRIERHYLNGPAFGGLVGSARGFGLFLQDQLKGHSVLFSDSTRALFYQVQSDARGEPVPMTPGWHVGDLDGDRFYYKEGGGGGFHCMMRLYPRSGIGTVVLTNATAFNVRRLLDAVDRGFAR